MLKVLANLCLLRASPSQLPFSRGILALLIFLYFLICYWTFGQLSEAIFVRENVPIKEMGLAITFIKGGSAFLAIAVLIGLLYVFFAKQKKISRLHKVLMAWFGTDLLLELLGISLPNFVILEMAFLIWNVFIKANILKYSLEITTNRALLLSVAFIFIHTLCLVEFFWIGLHFI